MEYPLISCYMATRDREKLVPRAIRCFQSQTYPNLELVIVDHGTDSTDQIVKNIADDRIRYERIHAPDHVTGDIKNMAIERAKGEYVAVWDDDDWSHASRIMLQYETLRNKRADICFLAREIIAWPERKKYAYSHFRRWENSLVAKKARLLPYAPQRRGGDFIQANEMMKAGRTIAYLRAPDLYIYVAHDANVWNSDHFEWMFEHVSAMLTPEQIKDVEEKLGVN